MVTYDELLLQALIQQGLGVRNTFTIDVTANQTETHTITDNWPIARGMITMLHLSVQAGGPTDLDVSFHINTDFDITDMIFRATSLSANDNEPTGGRPAGFNGLPYEEANGNAELHIETVENSGTGGTLEIRAWTVEG